MKAETTRRLLLRAWARALRMVWTRQRCQVALISLAIAALMPSWASETTSLTPRRPRLRSLRKNSVQKVSASEGPMSMPSTSRRPSEFTPTATITGDRDDAMVAAHFDVGRVDPRALDPGAVALERAIEKGFHPIVDLLAQPRHLALGDASAAHRPDEVVDRAGRHALHIGLLNDRVQRLLGHPPPLPEAREVRALAKLGDAQLDRSGSRLPVPIAVAVAF